jgi:hypothetical protein
MTPIPEPVRGTVRVANDRGVMLDEGDRWIHFSRYAAAGSIPKIEGGDEVELTLNGKGFIRSAVILDSLEPSPEFAPNGNLSRSSAALLPRNVQNIRETCIKSAAAFCAGRPELKSAELFALAEKMELWIKREA